MNRGNYSPVTSSHNNNMASNTCPPPIDHAAERYPYCIVWTPLPMISWFLPFIGHTGIGDSNGVLYDFAGPYTIGVGKLTFSAPTKYLPLDPGDCHNTSWDEGIREGNKVYKTRMHNIIFDNCHSHVAKCLNTMGYSTNGHAKEYTMIDVGVWMFFNGRFVSFAAFVKTYLPFTIIVLIVVLASKGFFSGR